jgi:NADH:ubiquinone oxidoreductase subunit H
MLAVSLLGTLEIFSLITFSTTQSSYVTLAFVRALEIFILVEIVTGFCILIMTGLGALAGAASVVSSTSAGMFALTGISVFLLFVVSMLAWEKAPFDVVEAESELIDGLTTEFEGYGFSLVYAAEVAGVLLSMKLFYDLAGFSLVSLILLVFASFVGRVFIVRFLLVDVVEFALSTGLFLSMLILVTVFLRKFVTCRVSAITAT